MNSGKSGKINVKENAVWPCRECRGRKLSFREERPDTFKRNINTTNLWKTAALSFLRLFAD